jgi:2-haloacid dehalogenase
MMACRYQWLLFDADGTLFDYDRAETAALARTFERAGVAFELAYVPVYRRINSALWQALERKETTQAALKVQRFKSLFETLGLAPAPPELPEVYLECLADCSELVAGATELFEQLANRCQVAIATNGLRKVQRPRIERSLIRHHVKHVIISEEIGAAKPAPEFFDIAFAQLGHPPKNRVLMVGDNWGADIAGAASFGLDTCWFNPNRLPRPALPPITLEIAALSELGRWLFPA